MDGVKVTEGNGDSDIDMLGVGVIDGLQIAVVDGEMEADIDSEGVDEIAGVFVGLCVKKACFQATLDFGLIFPSMAGFDASFPLASVD